MRQHLSRGAASLPPGPAVVKPSRRVPRLVREAASRAQRPRAQPVPRVSASMAWHDLTAWLDNPDTPPPTSSPAHVIQRLDEQGDLFAPLGE